MNRHNFLSKIKTLDETDSDKIIVSMIKFQDSIYVATQRGVYRVEDDKLIRLEFVEKNENNST